MREVLLTRFNSPWLWLLALVVMVGCGDDSSSASQPASQAGASAGTAGTGAAGGAAVDGGYTCTPPSDCPDIDLSAIPVAASFFSGTACCSPMTRCGYEVPAPDEETLMYFPQITDFIAMLTADDPNGRCAPENVYFGPRPGLWEHRVAVEGGDDILITPGCESYTLFAFILSGCCLPDNTCGLSTHESAPTLGALANDFSAPFASPQCVSAEVLNQQLGASLLAPLAKVTASGSCDYAALDAALPDAM